MRFGFGVMAASSIAAGAVAAGVFAPAAAMAAPAKPGVTGPAVVELGQIASFDARFKARDDTRCHDPVFTWGDGTSGDLDPSVTATPGVFSDEVPVACGPQLVSMSGKAVTSYGIEGFSASHVYCAPGTFTISVRAPKALKVKGKRVHSMNVQVVAPADGGVGLCQAG